MRSLHYEERLQLFKATVNKFHPSLVVLDGVSDLLADINGKAVLQLSSMLTETAKSQSVQSDMFDLLAADSGDSPSS